MKRRFAFAPEEGWLTLGLVLLLCLTLAWSVDGAKYVLGRDEYLDFLVIAAAGGVLAGFIGPKVGWGRWLTFLVGSIFAALIVPLLTGLIVHKGGAPLHDLFQSTSDAGVAAYIDIVRLGRPATTQFLHHAMIIGLLIWATSMFASYAVFGHRRSLSAVVVVGVLLVANMSINAVNQLFLLVVFSLASLFLLIRAHVFDEQSEWLRRRIGDPASISTVYLRGGTGFIAVTVALAFALTVTASSAPLAGAWGGVGDGLLSLSRTLSRYLPTGGATRSLGVTFGTTSSVKYQWNNNDGLALTIQRDPTDKKDYYWRAFAYDQIGLNDWSVGVTTNEQVPADASILEGLVDDPIQAGRQTATFTITPEGFHDPTMLSPATPTKVQEKSRISYVGEGGYFSTLERDGGTGPYIISASVQVRGNAAGELNATALRATGRNYPADMLAIYTQLPAGALGPSATALEKKIVDKAGKVPIDFAEALNAELRSSTYTYDTDVSDVPCGAMSTTECFATYKHGFCQWYALTMVTIMRHEGIPARMVEGFLPGSRDQNGVELIRNNNAHAWVEGYFPDYGWMAFDPTGVNLPTQLAVALPSGPPLASTSPRASTSAGPVPSFGPRGLENENGPNGPSGTSSRGSAGPLIAVGALLLLLVGVLAFVVWRRGPRGATTADAAYGMVTRIASRLGFAPRPAQTVYEYAGTLSDVLPEVRPELETVARAKVEAVYAREVLGEERIASLRAAQRRLRVALLRLVFRRKERRRRP